MEVQGIERKQADQFPYSGIRVLGAVQTGIGVSCALLGGLDLALTLTTRDAERQTASAVASSLMVYDTLVTLTVAACPLWCGMWFIIAGAIGTCVSRVRAHSLLFFRNTFLTLSVLCAALFGPACFGVTCFEAVLRHGLYADDYRWLIPLLVAFLSLFELTLAIVSAAMCCCCSSVQLTKVHVLFAAPSSGPRPQEVFRLDMNESPRRPSTYMMPGQGRIRALPTPEAVQEAPRPEEAYVKLKKWALPD
ncbi:uncharacterized protein [Haliotis cracherodii]|uniref:uncharacterized protein n=1 Tax=Haliotis cracherodii TaxID=6455 RepID=UPI0039EABBB4